MPDAKDIRIEDLQRLSGGASREAWIFDVSWRDDRGACFEPCIIMREPVSSVLVSDSDVDAIDGTRRTTANEIRALGAMGAAGLPVPEVLWFDTGGAWLERPFSIARRLPGTADVADIVGTPAAEGMLEQFIELLGKLHELDPTTAGVDFLGTPTAGTCAIDQVNQFELNFDSQRLEAFPATSYIIRWLKKYAPEAGRVSIVHGDYRLGNFMHENGEIIALLDWEQVHIGDPVEEIAFMYWSLWTMEPICPLEDFVQRYEAMTGTRWRITVSSSNSRCWWCC
jgi:aminoglycoside phosphotransferase (APT) family kinase protein